MKTLMINYGKGDLSSGFRFMAANSTTLFKVRFPPYRIFSSKLTSAAVMRGSAYLLLCLYLILKVDLGETASSNLGITHRNRTKESHKNSEPVKKGREGSTTRTDAKNPTKSVMFRDERLCFVVRRIFEFASSESYGGQGVLYRQRG